MTLAMMSRFLVGACLVAILIYGCSPRPGDSLSATDRRRDAVAGDRALDMSDVDIEREIDRIVALRSAADAGDAAARSALGPELDAREADLWSALRASRDAMALASLRRAGLVAGDGTASAPANVLEGHLRTLMDRLATVEVTLSMAVLPIEMGRINAQIARRERALVLAEMALVRRLLGSTR